MAEPVAAVAKVVGKVLSVMSEASEGETPDIVHQGALHGLLHCHLRTAKEISQQSKSFAQLSTSFLMIFVGIVVLRVHNKLRRALHWIQPNAVVTIAGLIFGALAMAFKSYDCDGAMIFKETTFQLVILPPVLFQIGFSTDISQLRLGMKYFLSLSILGFLLSLVFGGILLSSAWNKYFGMDFLTEGDNVKQRATMTLLTLSMSIIEPAAVVEDVVEANPDYDETPPPLLTAVSFSGVSSAVLGMTGFFVTSEVFSGSNTHTTSNAAQAGVFFLIEFVWKGVVAIVLSICLGLIIGLLSAVFFRLVQMRKFSNWSELLMFIIIAYGSFYVTNYVQFRMKINSIVSFPPHLVTFVVGVIMGNLTWFNLSPLVRVAIPFVVESFSSIAEVYTYMVLGTSFWVLNTNHYKPVHMPVLITMVLVHYAIRVLVVVVFVVRVNYLPGMKDVGGKYTDKITGKQFLLLVFASTSLGHVSYGLAVSANEESKIEIESTVWLLVAFTVVVQGSIVPLMIRKFCKGAFIRKTIVAETLTSEKPPNCIQRAENSMHKHLGKFAKFLKREDSRDIDRLSYLIFTEEMLSKWDDLFDQHRAGIHRSYYNVKNKDRRVVPLTDDDISPTSTRPASLLESEKFLTSVTIRHAAAARQRSVSENSNREMVAGPLVFHIVDDPDN